MQGTIMFGPLVQRLVIMTAVLGTPMSAQTPDTASQTAETITAATLTQQLARLTADSLWDRRTPSAPLERTAQALATQFQALGLWPGGRPRSGDGFEDTVWIQRYPLPGRTVRLDDAQSQLVFSYGPQRGSRAVLNNRGEPAWKKIAVPFTPAVRFVVPRVPEASTFENKAPTAVLLTGRPTAAFLRQIDVAGKAVLYLPPADLDTAAQQAVVAELYQTARGVMLLAVQDSASFVMSPQSQHPLQLADQYLQHEDGDDPHRWGVAVRAAALGELLPMLGVDLVQARTARAPAVRELPNLRVWLEAEFEQPAKAIVVDSAPNVIGVIAGTGLRYECIVLTVPLDQRGSRLSGADSTARWTDASTVNLAGLLELTRAFYAVRPQRTVVLLATSGGAKDQAFWGSRYYINRKNDSCNRPSLNLTLDLSVGGPMLGDTAVLAGLDDVVFAQPPTWIAALHPELGLVLKDDGTVAAPRSDATVFGQGTIPSLLVQRGSMLDGAAREQSVPASELARIAQLLRFVFYLGQESANTKQTPPRLSSVGRQRLLGEP